MTLLVSNVKQLEAFQMKCRHLLVRAR